jgi:hypothetical protein
MLSEEDKANPVSIRYWFELIDTNEDGVLRADEMRVFYRHQIHRMECLGHEVVPFEDILCQMSDLLHPENEGEFFHKDFVRPDKIRVSGVFFNVLFNLSKFIEFEQRDPFLLRQQLAEPELTYVLLLLMPFVARPVLTVDSAAEQGLGPLRSRRVRAAGHGGGEPRRGHGHGHRHDGRLVRVGRAGGRRGGGQRSCRERQRRPDGRSPLLTFSCPFQRGRTPFIPPLEVDGGRHVAVPSGRQQTPTQSPADQSK